MAQTTLPPWIQALQKRDPEFVDSYMAQRERIMRDGAIPAKYKHLMTMIVDALLAHPDGVATIANRARAAGASEAEIGERSEEHTSELQSPCNLVCRLLLEKKKISQNHATDRDRIFT